MKQDLKKTLGPLIALHRYPPLRWRDVIPWLIPGVMAVILPLWVGLSRYQHGYANFGTVAADHWSRPWYQLTGLALVLFAWLLISHLRSANRFVAVHQKGLYIALSRTAVYRWEQLAGISTMIEQQHFFKYSLPPRYQAILYPNVGKPIHLPDRLNEFPELLTQTKARLYPRLSTDLRASFESGKWAYFGLVAINQQQLRFKKSSFPWSAVSQLTIERGNLVIELDNHDRLSIPVLQIPNLEILLQLVRLGVAA